MRKAIVGAAMLVCTCMAQGQAGAEEGGIERAVRLVEQERYAQAQAILDKMLHEDEERIRARMLNGIIATRTGQLDRARIIFEHLTEQYPAMVEGWNNLAVVYAIEGSLDQAKEILARQIENEKDGVVYDNLKEIHARIAEMESGADTGEGAGDRDDTATLGRAVPASDEPRRGDAGDTDAPLVIAAAGMGEEARGVPPESQEVTQSAEAVLVAQPRQEPDETMDAERTAGPVLATADESDVVDDQGPPEGEQASAMTAMEPPLTPERGSGAGAGAGLKGDEKMGSGEMWCVESKWGQRRRRAQVLSWWMYTYGAENAQVQTRQEGERRTRTLKQIYLGPYENTKASEEVLRALTARGVTDIARITKGELANTISVGIYAKEWHAERRVRQMRELGYEVKRAPWTQTSRGTEYRAVSNWETDPEGVLKSHPGRPGEVSVARGACPEAG